MRKLAFSCKLNLRDRETERQRDRETERQRGREAERQRDRVSNGTMSSRLQSFRLQSFRQQSTHLLAKSSIEPIRLQLLTCQLSFQFNLVFNLKNANSRKVGDLPAGLSCNLFKNLPYRFWELIFWNINQTFLALAKVKVVWPWLRFNMLEKACFLMHIKPNHGQTIFT